METYKIEWLPGEKIIMGQLEPDFQVMRDTPPSSAVLLSLLEASDEPVPYLLDLTAVKLTFGEMTQAMALLTRGELASFVHPKLRQLVIVSQEALIKLGAAALGQSQYGGRKAQVVASVEEGLKYLRAQAKLNEELAGPK